MQAGIEDAGQGRRERLATQFRDVVSAAGSSPLRPPVRPGAAPQAPLMPTAPPSVKAKRVPATPDQPVAPVAKPTMLKATHVMHEAMFAVQQPASLSRNSEPDPTKKAPPNNRTGKAPSLAFHHQRQRPSAPTHQIHPSPTRRQCRCNAEIFLSWQPRGLLRPRRPCRLSRHKKLKAQRSTNPAARRPMPDRVPSADLEFVNKEQAVPAPAPSPGKVTP